MKDFSFYLSSIGEIGFVDQAVHSLVYSSGLPNVHPKEIVLFEGGGVGQVMSLTRDATQILLLSHDQVRVGTQVVRTGEYLQIPVTNDLLGKTIDPLGKLYQQIKPLQNISYRTVDTKPPSISQRKPVEKQLDTGVGIVDLILPLGKGQRELVIGDRKTGKTEFLLQTILTQAAAGTICIYAVIGQKKTEIIKLDEILKEKGIRNNCIIVASSSSEPAGLVFLTPYTAMTIAEYFRDQGMDVLLVLDDMTTHARTYREISLLARRFPGRASYPGDIFYVHAKLIERAGAFTKGTITCLPVAESILGDLSGYIQTNLMSMTDGHIFFDIELYNQGNRPSINPFLSVTRVGHQTQGQIERDLSSKVTSFLVQYEHMKQFMHFGSEAGEITRNILAMGERIDLFFNQGTESIVPLPINILIIAAIWAGTWNEVKIYELKARIEEIIERYTSDASYKKKVLELISNCKRFDDLVNILKRDAETYIAK
jgi:F-type H+/Na+-transporting ATPase subunit alpha